MISTHTSDDQCTHFRWSLHTLQMISKHTSDDQCTHFRWSVHILQMISAHTSDDQCTHLRWSNIKLDSQKVFNLIYLQLCTTHFVRDHTGYYREYPLVSLYKVLCCLFAIKNHKLNPHIRQHIVVFVSLVPLEWWYHYCTLTNADYTCWS